VRGIAGRNALTVYNGELIAGGSFTTAGGVVVHRNARWNARCQLRKPLPNGPG